MCAGAILAGRLARVVFGAWDDKAGAAGSVVDVLRERRLPHRVEVVSGVFRSGDVVRMMDGADAGDVFGFIEPAGDGKAGFMATVFSSPGGSRLQLYRYGVADLQIEPSLLDRVLRNPILLALGVLLAVLGAVSSAVQLARWVWFGGEKGA